MPVIRIREEDFPHEDPDLEDADEPDFFHEVNPGMEFTREELLHAAWTSGHEQAFFQQQGPEGMLHYIQWKRSAIEMSIREVIDGPIQRWGATPMLGAMDPSERQGASYHLGLMMATAWARRRHNIPWLLHLDLYRNQHEVNMRHDAGKSRPDLVGMDVQGRWAVFETKGRKGPPSTQSKKDAKRQAMRVQTVANEDPAHRLAIFAHFGPEPNNIAGRCHLQCLVIDPPGDPKHPRPMKLNFISKQNYFQHYYQPWLDLFPSKQTSTGSDEMIWMPLRSLNIEIGIFAELEYAMRMKEWEKAPSIINSRDGKSRYDQSQGYWAGDGLVVRGLS